MNRLQTFTLSAASLLLICAYGARAADPIANS